MSNITMVVEEIERYATSYKIEQYTERIIDIGRHRGIGLFCTARRIKGTAPKILFNSDHIIAFHQRRPEDVDYLVNYVGETAFRIRSLPEYYYVWYVDRTGETHICKPV